MSACAVGPDFKVPAAPETAGYTKGTLPARTASTDTAIGEAQRFQKEKDISATWWQLFHSRALNSLIEKSLEANPNLQSAMAALRVARLGVYAQEGHYFPTVQANYNPSRQETASDLSPVLNNTLAGQNPFNFFTAQVMVSYTPDVWGLNRRTIESLHNRHSVCERLSRISRDGKRYPNDATKNSESKMIQVPPEGRAGPCGSPNPSGNESQSYGGDVNAARDVIWHTP